VSYKFAFILSLLFVVQILILGGDIFALQVVYTNLDALGQTTSFRIAQAGRIDEATTMWLLSKNTVITCLQNCTPRFGDTLEFKLETTYDPLIISSETMTISVTRSAVIGYYN
jgi:hypothetical protein